MGTTHQTIEINASPDTVWQTIRNFHDLSWAPNVVAKVDKVGDKAGDEIGAGRVLNGMFHETLISLDDDRKDLSYSIDDGPSPVSKVDVKNYVGKVTVQPAAEGDGSHVEWSSSWQDNDEAAADFCHGIYVALLQDLKTTLE
jgi:carbon monoxide dehydrogenase subunit G